MASLAPDGTMTWWVWSTVALALLGFLVNGALAIWKPNAKRAVSIVGCGVVVAAFAVSVAVFLELWTVTPEHPYILTLWSWLPVDALQVDLALQVDQLSAVMMLIVTGVGGLIHLFSIGYMGDDPGYARYFSYLNLFIAFMLILVLGANFPVLFIGWEGVGLCSYLLIGFWFEDRLKADAGKKAFIVNRIGDLGFLIAMLLIWWSVGSLDFSEVFRSAPAILPLGGATITAITLFLFLGCVGKSAQIPLYVWLPDAMAGPTPVSALIHAATMVTAGVYLVARTGVLFAMAPVSSLVVAGVGAVTALFAATIGLRQYDIKKVLAYSTVSQLGYMFVGVGTGAYAAGDLSSCHPRVLQGAALPRSGQRDSCDAPCLPRDPLRRRCPGHAEHGWTPLPHALDLRAHGNRHAGHCRDSAVLRFLLQGRDSRLCLRARRR